MKREPCGCPHGFDPLNGPYCDEHKEAIHVDSARAIGLYVIGKEDVVAGHGTKSIGG